MMFWHRAFLNAKVISVFMNVCKHSEDNITETVKVYLRWKLKKYLLNPLKRNTNAKNILLKFRVMFNKTFWEYIWLKPVFSS